LRTGNSIKYIRNSSFYFVFQEKRFRKRGRKTVVTRSRSGNPGSRFPAELHVHHANTLFVVRSESGRCCSDPADDFRHFSSFRSCCTPLNAHNTRRIRPGIRLATFRWDQRRRRISVATATTYRVAVYHLPPPR